MCKQNIHQNLFFLQIKFTSKSDPLSNLFVRNLADSKKFSIRNFRVVKNGSKSDTFEIPDSKHDASYKKCFKNQLFSKILIQFLFFWMKTFFSATNFPRMHKKANIDVFTVYIDQLNCTLRASFPKNFHLLTTLFSSKTDAL